MKKFYFQCTLVLLCFGNDVSLVLSGSKKITQQSLCGIHNFQEMAGSSKRKTFVFPNEKEKCKNIDGYCGNFDIVL